MQPATCSTARPRATSASDDAQRHDAHGLWRSPAFPSTLLQDRPGSYFTGDGRRRCWTATTGSPAASTTSTSTCPGHRLGTAEAESALVAHPLVAASGVAGCPHDIKARYLRPGRQRSAGEEPSDALRKELIAHVRKEIGPIATPDYLQWAPGLPKTRSGKIMRRILRKIAENLPDQLGDISTLADPSVVQNLVGERLVRRDRKRDNSTRAEASPPAAFLFLYFASPSPLAPALLYNPDRRRPSASAAMRLLALAQVAVPWRRCSSQTACWRCRVWSRRTSLMNSASTCTCRAKNGFSTLAYLVLAGSGFAGRRRPRLREDPRA